MTVSGNDGRPELDGLRAFVREGDRNRARFFVGRAAQLRDIESACADAFAGFRAGRPLAGTTRLIQGAPGAGKTALLRHFEDIATRARTERGGVLHRFFAAADQKHPRTGVVLLDVDDLGHPERLVQRIAEWLDPKKARRLRQTRSHSAGVRAGTPGIGARSSETVSTGPPQGDLAELGRLFAPKDWPGPLCLMVDEIQTMRAEQAPVLQSLHLATVGLPVVPVLAGLANARDVLARCGISRLSEDGVHMLGCLDAGEPAEAVLRMLAEFRIRADGADTGRWATRLEAHSDGWPQHLHNGLRSLAEALVGTGGALGDVDIEAVLHRAQERRLQAYRARRSTHMQASIFLLARVMAAVPDTGLRRNEAIAVVRTRARTGDGHGWDVPEGMSAGDFLDHLVLRGALQSGEDDRLVCPIPSLRRFLIEEAADAFGCDFGGLAPDDSTIVEFGEEMSAALDE